MSQTTRRILATVLASPAIGCSGERLTRRSQQALGAARTRTGALLLLLACGCSGGGSGANGAGVTGPSSAVNLTGAWTGGGSGFGLEWRLTQEGDRITGTSAFRDAHTTGAGRVSGTLSGSTLTWTDEYPLGALSQPGCSEVASGTAQVDRDSIFGTYRSVRTCSGSTDGGTSAGTFNLARR